MIAGLLWIVFGFAIFSATMFGVNWLLFQPPPKQVAKAHPQAPPPQVSVLIPARNEAAGIADAIQCVLANESVELEVLILDDQSSDATAKIAASLAEADTRIRLINGDALPDGWCGKQFACQQLATAATSEHLLFLDADVRLRPNAIALAMEGMRNRAADLWSGFPRLRTESLGEGILIPMIYLVLLTYLPMFFMRWTRMHSAAAGCGQFFLTTKTAYEEAGGHASIRNSLHDGVTLPRSYRSAGLRTDLFDASPIASCRMYDGWSESWSGLSKNAHEGIATTRRIVPFTVLLFMGYIAPTLLLAVLILCSSPFGLCNSNLLLAAIGSALSYLPRLLIAWRYDRNWPAALLLPISVTLFLCLQWRAFFARRRGQPSTWRGRSYIA